MLRAAHFRVITCTPLTFRVTAGPAAPYAVFTAGGEVTASPADDLWTDARLWFSFTGQAAGTSAPNSTVTIHCEETNEDFIFTLSVNSIARPTVAAMLVLDQSGSMDDQAGATGVTRIQALRESAARRSRAGSRQPPSSQPKAYTWSGSWRAASPSAGCRSPGNRP
jgi:hypothetical protein